MESRNATSAVDLTKPLDVTRLPEVVHRQAKRPEPGWVSGLTQAQELLDWLENHGCTGLEAQCQSETSFAVSCACPPGLRLDRDEGGAVHLLPA
jgi:hypothetical protein